MKRFIAVVAALCAMVALYAVAAPAGQQSVTPKQFKKLTKRVTRLEKKVKTLKTQETMDRNIAVTGLVYAGCSVAVTADGLQGTWTTVDEHATFGAQTELSDYGLCHALGITRQGIANPPSASVFGNLLDLFKPTASAARPHIFGMKVVIPLR